MYEIIFLFSVSLRSLLTLSLYISSSSERSEVRVLQLVETHCHSLGHTCLLTQKLNMAEIRDFRESERERSERAQREWHQSGCNSKQVLWNPTVNIRIWTVEKRITKLFWRGEYGSMNHHLFSLDMKSSEIKRRIKGAASLFNLKCFFLFHDKHLYTSGIYNICQINKKA